MSLTHRTIAFRLLLGVLLSLFAFSCKQYEYASPLPGVLEVRLKVVNSPPPTGNAHLIPFSSSSQFPNGFVMQLKELNVILSGDIKQLIFADLYAITRPDEGDFFNVLDTLARDSVIILGQAYLPPGTYSGLDMTANYIGGIRIFRGLFFNPYTGTYQVIFQNVNVVQPPPPTITPNFFQIPRPPQSANIRINEGALTRVTLSLNLDSVLVRRTEDFEIHPSFTISSVKNF